MTKKTKKQRLSLTAEPYILSWYPSERSFSDMDPQKNGPKRIPPLMVRKAEWRR